MKKAGLACVIATILASSATYAALFPLRVGR